MKMGIKVLECNKKKTVDQWTLMYSPKKLSMVREPAIDGLKALKNDSRFLSQNKLSEVDGMKSAGRRALRYPPSPNTRYSTKLYNVEGLDHKVHEPVIVPRMVDMQSQDN